MVEAVSNALAPWTQLLAFIGALTGILIYFRKWLKKITDNTQTTHADGSVESVADKTQVVAAKTQTVADHSIEQNAAIVELAEQLGLSKQSQDWMAKRNDDMLTALLNLVTLFRDEKIADRVRHTEEGMAAIETEVNALTRAMKLFTETIATRETRP